MAPLETVAFGGEGVLFFILEGCKCTGPVPLVTLSLLPGGQGSCIPGVNHGRFYTGLTVM